MCCAMLMKSSRGLDRGLRPRYPSWPTKSALRVPPRPKMRMPYLDMSPSCAPQGDVAIAASPRLSINIPTADARNCIRFQLVPSGNGQAIVVQAVAEGSSAEEAGVQVGMKLTAISDPVRRDDVWELQDRPSIRYIRDVLRMRSSPFIQLKFDPPADEALAALNAAATAAAAADGSLELAASSGSAAPSAAAAAAPAPASSSSSSSTRSVDSLGSLESLSALSSMSEGSAEEQTVAERLQQQYEQAQQAGKALTAVQQRQQRRKEYMEAAKQRDDNGFLAIVAACFILPALVILLVAYSSGYLDNLYSNSLSNFR